MLCKGFIINAKNYLNVFWPFSHCVSSVLWLVKARPGKRYNVYTKMKCSDRMCCKYLYPWLSVTDWKFMVHIDRAILAIIVCTLLWPPSRHVGGVWRCSKWKVHYMVAWDFTQENVWNTVPSWKILKSDWHFFVRPLFALASEFPKFSLPAIGIIGYKDLQWSENLCGPNHKRKFCQVVKSHPGWKRSSILSMWKPYEWPSQSIALSLPAFTITSPTCLHCCGRVSDSPPNCVEMWIVAQWRVRTQPQYED